MRDIRYDTLRGIMLMIMTVDHVSGFSLPLYECFGFFSAAEGFVLLSGLVIGIVYGKLVDTAPFSDLVKKARSRAKIIYVSHIFIYFLILFAALASSSFAVNWGIWEPLIVNEPFKAALLGPLLLDQPSYLDILPMYVLFVILSPMILLHFKSNNEKFVLLLSVIVWGLAQCGLRDLVFSGLGNYVPINLGVFDIFAWQILYISGLYVGYFVVRRKRELLKFNGFLFLFSVAAAAVIFLVKYGKLDFIQFGNIDLDFFTNKETLGPLRLLNFYIFCYIVASVSMKSRNILNLPIIAYLGKHSLQVFSFSILLVFLAKPYYHQLTSLSGYVVLAFLVLSLYIPAGLHEMYSSYRTGANIIKTIETENSLD